VAIGKEKARVVAVVLQETKMAIAKFAQLEERSESSMAAKLLRIGLEHYKYENNGHRRSSK
jgi:D-alanyl-D-alanine carboxypeptidase